ncbi:YusW family protein [Edaphobacillus lindanitolerans]|uniref:YusW-like protein n=1 Tax=Edaphobacillus lindanitolerans TaxID=550447 RepID=A0A1U7PIT5_9BACI|nr:YusW family protein [Edaphobacillus lindanitolerans]SIT75714.1 YusW-like protein [Edaphobacillus lindanitolerans]
MKRQIAFPMIVAGSLVLAACGSGEADKETEAGAGAAQADEGNAAGKGEQPAGDAAGGGGSGEAVSAEAADITGQEEMQQKMDEITYSEFELEVEYAEGQEYEAEIERKSDNTVKAKIEDSLDGMEKKGLEAFNELYPLVEQMSITSGTPKEEAIREVLSVFSLPDDYTKFDLELRFKDDSTEFVISDQK